MEWFQTGKQPMLDMFCGDKTAEVKVWDASIYPDCPAVDAEQTCFTRADTLLDRINRVKYAACFHRSKPELSGVRFEDHHVWCVDGCRMAVNDSPDLRFKDRFIISADALKHLKVFGKNEVNIEVGKRFAAFSDGGMKLYCRLLDASDRLRVETALPETGVETCHIRREEYMEALRYLSDCAGGMKKRGIQFRNGTLLLTGEETKFSARVHVDGPCELEYAFNLNYMKDALGQFAGAETLEISSGGTSPIVLKSGADTALVLPIRMRDIQRAA